MRVYYTGDMANQPGWFRATGNGEGQLRLVEEDYPDSEQRVFTVYPHHIGHVYQGHCSPRFVTEAAYKAFRASRRWLTDIERSVLGVK